MKSVFIIFLFIEILFTMAPDKKIQAREVNKGAIFTSIGFVIVTYIYSAYTTNFAKYDVFYGNLASIVVLMIWFYFRIPTKRRFFALQLILIFVAAGAVGNLMDRIALGYVTDFIYFELIDFPVFNVADCYITVSAFLLVFLVLFFYKEEEIDQILKIGK